MFESVFNEINLPNGCFKITVFYTIEITNLTKKIEKQKRKEKLIEMANTHKHRNRVFFLLLSVVVD